MKLFRFVAAACLLAACSVHAQQLKWKPLHLPQGQYVNTLFTYGDIVYAGTTRGIFRSTDHGRSWVPSGLVDFEIDDFAVSPPGARSQYLFVCSHGNGVFRSADSGKSWLEINNGLPHNVLYRIAACLNDSGGTTLFAALWYKGVYHSTDDGANWSAANGDLPSAVLLHQIQDVITCPNDSGGTDLFIGTTRDGLYHSSDGGKHWVQRLSWDYTHFIIDFSVIPMAEGKPAIYALSYEGIYRSRDRGITWKFMSGLVGNSLIANDGMLYMSTNDNGVLCSSDSGATWTSAGVAGDERALTISDSLLIAGTWGGILRSSFGTTQWTSGNYGLMCARPSSFAVLGSEVFAGALGGIYRFGKNDTIGVAVNNGLTSCSITSLATIDPYIFAGTEDRGVFRSSDRGEHWMPFAAGITDLHITALASDKGIIAASAMWGKVFLSSDTGRTWLKLSIETNYESVFSVCIRDSNIFAGSTEGRIYHSADLGATWTVRMIDSSMYLPYGEIRSLMMKGDRLYAVMEYDLYVSTDMGASWMSCGLQEKYPGSVAANETLFVAGTANGVFISKTAGANWQPRITANDIGGNVTAIAIVGDKIYGGLQDGGVYYKTIADALTAVRDPGAPVPAGFTLHQNYPNPFNPSTTISFTIPERSFVDVKVFDVLGREVAVIVSETMSAGSYSRRWDASGLSSGIYFYRLHAGALVETKRMTVVK